MFVFKCPALQGSEGESMREGRECEREWEIGSARTATMQATDNLPSIN